jgi:hypothetical protein
VSGGRGASEIDLSGIFGPIPGDRRAARGYFTKVVLADATIDLFQAGNPQPTTGQVAERAEVSWRTLFNHYRIDGLYCVAAATQVLRSLALIVPVPAVGPLSVRIDVTCQQRRRLFEQSAILLHAVPSRPAAIPVLDHALDELATLLSHQMNRTFAREISRRSNGSNLADILDVPTGWESWIILRFGRQLSATVAQRHLAATMTRLLA